MLLSICFVLPSITSETFRNTRAMMVWLLSLMDQFDHNSPTHPIKSFLGRGFPYSPKFEFDQFV